MRNPVIISIIFILSVGACGYKATSKLDTALALSGENRGEWEKVLDHFSQDRADSLKLRAAIFLIENMPGHFTACYPRQTPAEPLPDDMPYALRQVIACFPDGCAELRAPADTLEDIRYLTGEFLIRHIEMVFQLKEASPWLQHVDWEVFSEYLLPYRMAHEHPLLNDYSANKLHRKFLNKIRFFDDCLYSVNALAFQIKDTLESIVRSRKTDSLLSACIGKPVNREKLLLALYRQIGIPCAFDQTPLQNNVWISLFDGKRVITECSRVARAGKIYRETFCAHPVPEPATGEHIPPFFQNPHLQDVTGRYVKTADVIVPVSSTVKKRYAYLAVCSNGVWQPVCYGEIKGRKCLFTNLETDCIYLPVCYGDKGMETIGAPFILHCDKRVSPLAGQGRADRAARIKHIRPYTDAYNYYQTTLLENIYFESTDAPGAAGKEQAPVFSDYSADTYTYTIYPEYPDAKRYWRIGFSSGEVQVAELHFHTPEGEVMPDVVSAGDSILTDHDLTTYKSVIRGQVFDFKRPVLLKEIQYSQPVDAGYILPRHEYQLFAWQGNEWRSAGILKADAYCLVPDGLIPDCLYKLTDITSNVEGNIFTYGKYGIKFW